MTVAIIVGACGATSSPSSQVTSTIKSYLVDLESGNGSAGCNLLTASAAHQLVRAAASVLGVKTCPQLLRAAAAQLTATNKQKLLNAKVIDVTVAGNSATARVQGATRTAHLTKNSGRWLISGGFN